jgi:tRNA-splicing ligase RtcB
VGNQTPAEPRLQPADGQKGTTNMQYIDNIPVWGEHEQNTIDQARTCARHADYFALMADGHLGYGVPIGGVIASKNRISPTAVGFDIACGNKAVRLDIPASEVRANIDRIMDDIWSTLSFGVGRRNNENNSARPSSAMRMRVGPRKPQSR